MTAGPLTLPATGESRTPLRIDVDRGRIETAGQRAKFDPQAPDAALIAYLKLVRKLRDVQREPSFVLRRDDVVIIAGALRQDAVVVLDRLGELMGATVTQRRSMVTAFLAGALMIAVATGATALAPGDGRGPTATPTSGERSDVVASAPTDDEASRPATRPREGAGVGVGLERTPEPTVGGSVATVAASTAPPAPVAGAATSAPSAGAPGGATTPAPAPRASAPRVDDGPRTPRTERPAAGRPDREIVQPGATIDIPNDEEDVPVTTPVIEMPTDEPSTPPAGPPTDVTPPVVPPSEVPPPSDVTPGPPSDVTPPAGGGDEGNPGQGNPGQGNQGEGNPGQGNQGEGNPGQGNQGEGNRGVGQGGGGGNGTGNEGQGVGPQ